jgi:hypothetical protein
MCVSGACITFKAPLNCGTTTPQAREEKKGEWERRAIVQIPPVV